MDLNSVCNLNLGRISNLESLRVTSLLFADWRYDNPEITSAAKDMIIDMTIGTQIFHVLLTQSHSRTVRVLCLGIGLP